MFSSPSLSVKADSHILEVLQMQIIYWKDLREMLYTLTLP